MAGTVPAFGEAALGELYPPHPNHNIVSNNTEIVFMHPPDPNTPHWRLAKGEEVSVRLGSFFCKEDASISVKTEPVIEIPTACLHWLRLFSREEAISPLENCWSPSPLQ